MMVEEQADKWKVYYEKTRMRPPHKTVDRALALMQSEHGSLKGRRALDLGCGAGRDAFAMAEHGLYVFAVDREIAAINTMMDRAEEMLEEKVFGMHGDYTHLDLPKVDLVVSSFSLPHHPPIEFPSLWDRIVKCLNPGGRIAVHLYGKRDSWARKHNIVTLNRTQILNYLFDLNIEMLEEEETDAVTPKGEEKHWHIYHIVAKKQEIDDDDE